MVSIYPQCPVPWVPVSLPEPQIPHQFKAGSELEHKQLDGALGVTLDCVCPRTPALLLMGMNRPIPPLSLLVPFPGALSPWVLPLL